MSVRSCYLRGGPLKNLKKRADKTLSARFLSSTYLHYIHSLWNRQKVEQALDLIFKEGSILRDNDKLTMRRLIHEQEKPLLSDVRFPYKTLSEEDKMALRLLEEELEERERKEKKMGFIGKFLSSIKRVATQGLIENEE